MSESSKDSSAMPLPHTLPITPTRYFDGITGQRIPQPTSSSVPYTTTSPDTITQIQYHPRDLTAALPHDQDASISSGSHYSTDTVLPTILSPSLLASQPDDQSIAQALAGRPPSTTIGHPYEANDEPVVAPLLQRNPPRLRRVANSLRRRFPLHRRAGPTAAPPPTMAAPTPTPSTSTTIVPSVAASATMASTPITIAPPPLPLPLPLVRRPVPAPRSEIHDPNGLNVWWAEFTLEQRRIARELFDTASTLFSAHGHEGKNVRGNQGDAF